MTRKHKDGGTKLTRLYSNRRYARRQSGEDPPMEYMLLSDLVKLNVEATI